MQYVDTRAIHIPNWEYENNKVISCKLLQKLYCINEYDLYRATNCLEDFNKDKDYYVLKNPEMYCFGRKYGISKASLKLFTRSGCEKIAKILNDNIASSSYNILKDTFF